MKTWRVVVIGLMVGTCLACSGTTTRRSFRETLRDGKIKTAIRYKLSKDRGVKARHMEIHVWRGVATLTGHVSGVDERVRAEELTHGVGGVVAVENHLKPFPVMGAPLAITTTPPASIQAAAMPPKAEKKPVITAPSAGAVATAPAKTATPKTPAMTTAATQTPKTIVKPTTPKPAPVAAKPAAQPKAVTKPLAGPVTTPVTVEDLRPRTAGMPIPNAKPAPAAVAKGKALPWMDEHLDTEGPSMKPTKEFVERGRPTAAVPPVSVDEDLAREAAEELKRLRGSATQ
ncbi:MAG: BON domain-containing protein [Deltaproteobacteria bacterium]|nr:BON domain-containing protein [Deltaproteobacteria bacterium]